MLNISENAFRDYIFNNHKEDFSSKKMALIRLAWIFLGARILQASLSSS